MARYVHRWCNRCEHCLSQAALSAHTAYARTTLYSNPFRALEFDTVAVPGGHWCEHVNGSDSEPAILFVASDEPTLKALALYQKHGKTPEGDIVRID